MRQGNALHLADPKRPETYMVNPYPESFEKLTIPEGVSGNWKVRKFSCSDADVGLMNLRSLRDGHARRIIPPGEYTKLERGGTVVMSDTPAEAHEHAMAFRRAKGHVLVNGLGLGFFLSAILRKPEVEHVTVIEQSPDVMALVGPSFNWTSKVSFIQEDAFGYQPPKGQRYDFVWHDIWDDICADNLSEMTRLKRKYARRTRLQSCWSEDYFR